MKKILSVIITFLFFVVGAYSEQYVYYNGKCNVTSENDLFN